MLDPARPPPAKQKPRPQRGAVFSRRESEQVEGTLVRGAD